MAGGVQLGWAFNNAELSDIKLILTTETPLQSRAAGPNTTTFLERDAASTAGSSCAAAHVGRQFVEGAGAGTTATAAEVPLPASQSACLSAVGAEAISETMEEEPNPAARDDVQIGASGAKPTALGLLKALRKSLASYKAGASCNLMRHWAVRGACEELPAHKVVLASSSDYFRALISRWLPEEPGLPLAGRQGGEHAVVTVTVTITLASKESFSVFKKMIRFLYTHELEEGMERVELMQLLAFGDEYSVASLRCACLQQLAKVPLSDWPAANVHLFCSLAEIMYNDASVASKEQLAEIADATIQMLLKYFDNIESLWQSEELQAAFCCLPLALVLQVLSSSSLSVGHEDTVLVPALSWLRIAGKDAPLQERRQVLHAVRLLQLSPWLLSWLLFHAPEGVKLLTPQEKALILEYMSFPAAQERAALTGKVTQLGWVAGCRTYSPQRVLQLTLGTIPEKQIIGMVQTCFKDERCLIASFTTASSRFGMGFMWNGELHVCRYPQDASRVIVRVGVVPSLTIAGTKVNMGQAITDRPCSYMIQFSAGSTLGYNNKALRNTMWYIPYSCSTPPMQLPRLVPAWGCILCSFKAADDVESMQLKLQSCCKDGLLAVKATVLHLP